VTLTAIRAGFAAVAAPGESARGVAGGAALLVAAAALGAGLMAVSALFGDAAPAIALALPLAPLLAVIVVARPLLGVMAVLATMPFGSLGVSTGAVTLQSVEIAVLVVGTLIVLRRLALSQAPLPWSPLFAFPLALLAWTLFALYSAIDETLALKQIAALLGGWVFASVVLAACRDTRDVRRILGALTGIAVVMAILAISSGGGRLTSFYGGAQVEGRLTGAFDHPNQLGSLCAMAVAVAIGLSAGARTARGRLIAGAAPLLLLPALTLSLSRGAWIGMALGVVFLIATLSETRRMLLLLAVPVAVVGGVIWSAAPDQPELNIIGERARALTSRSPYDGRNEIWAAALQEIKNDPLTGTGPGSFPVAAVRANSPASSIAPRHAHNLFLNWATETGLPSAIIIVAFAIALGVATHRANVSALARGDPRDRAVNLGIAAALLTVVGQGFFDFVLGNPVLHITVWALVGCLIVAAREGVGLGGPSPGGRLLPRSL
jgi:putative inorganic carbon (hco3(-)) transporter